VLVISAHWYVNITAVTAMTQPRTIHDFYGFPQALFDVDYPAPGDPELARTISETVAPHSVGLDADSWGLDHGAWSILVHMYPEADVPVLQLSVHSNQPLGYHLDLGEALAPLREDGVMILASGNVVHNLGRVEWDKPGRGAPWAHEFDDAVRAVMTSDPGSLATVATEPTFEAAVPTPDHFLPLAYVAGIARAAGTTASTIIDGCELGSLSMTSYAITS
jgi:4,5-DOPA dioxygenase extradiol